jgi:hypothetical protein
MLDNFLKAYYQSHYQRHPKSKAVVIVAYILLTIILVVFLIKAYILLPEPALTNVHNTLQNLCG